MVVDYMGCNSCLFLKLTYPGTFLDACDYPRMSLVRVTDCSSGIPESG